MENQYQYRYTLGRKVGGTILAVLLGAIAPLLIILQVMLPLSSLCLAMMFGVFLNAYAGKTASIVYALALVASAFVFLEIPMAIAALCVVVPPMLSGILGMRKKQYFFHQLRNNLIAGAVGSAMAYMSLVQFYGSDFIAQTFLAIKNVFDSTKDMVWLFYGPMLRQTDPTMTAAVFGEMYYTILKQLQIVYEQTLLANLLGTMLISCTLATLWGNWIQARHGEATQKSFLGVYTWNLPHELTLGMILIFGIAYVTTYTSIPGAAMAWMIVSTLVKIAFAGQMLGAFDRRLKADGASHTRRVIMSILMIVTSAICGGSLGPVGILAFFGLLSALFGRRGVIRKFLMPKNNDE